MGSAHTISMQKVHAPHPSLLVTIEVTGFPQLLQVVSTGSLPQSTIPKQP